MKYVLKNMITCVETVIDVVGSSMHGLVLASVPEPIAMQKVDIAAKIEEEMRMLQEKHQSGFYNGHIFAQPGSRKWEAYFNDYEENVVPLLHQYHRLTPSGTKTWKEIVSDPKRKYHRGDVYVK